MRKSWLALQHASEELRADRSIVEGAVRRHRGALIHASKELRADSGLLQLAERR